MQNNYGYQPEYTGVSVSPPVKDEKRAIDNHNTMIENESRQLWKEAYLNYHTLPPIDRPTKNGMYLTPTEYATNAASNYIKTWSKK